MPDITPVATIPGDAFHIALICVSLVTVAVAAVMIKYHFSAETDYNYPEIVNNDN